MKIVSIFSAKKREDEEKRKQSRRRQFVPLIVDQVLQSSKYK